MKPQSKKKQVLVFMLAPPLPAVAGGDIYAVNALVPFAQEIDFHLFCYVGDEEKDGQKIRNHQAEYDRVFRSIHMQPRPLMPFQRRRLRWALAMLQQVAYGLPFIDASYYSRSAVAAARAIVRDKGVDALEVNSAHLAFFKRFLPSSPAVLVSHNIESDIFPFWIPGELKGWRRRFVEWVAARSRRAAREVEQENGFGFNAMTFISRNDMDRVDGSVPKYLMPLSFPRVGRPYDDRPRDQFHVLWMGGFGWYPNAEGVIWFAREIFPHLKDQLAQEGIVLHFCGSHPPEELRAIHDGKNVHVHGFVDDINAMLDQAHLLMVPLRSGGGIRVKIVEAMSNGVPVLSTSKGCEGIGATDGRDIIVRDDPAAFAQALLAAASDASRMRALSEAGLRLMAEQYSQESSLAAKRKAYEHMGVL